MLLHGPVTVTHPDIIRYFMTIPEASQLVLQSGAMANNGELFVLDMGQPVKILDLAQNMIKLSGAHDIEIVETGLRPGEKLYEELLMNSDTLTKTDNDLIFIEKDTPLSKEEIEALEESNKNEPHLRKAHKALAKEVITFIHGADAYEEAVSISEKLFSGDIKSMTYEQVFQDTQIRPDIQLLMNEGNAMSLSLQRILEAHLLAVNKNLSLILLMDACQDIHERGFTSTILTHERMYLTAFQRQAYALQHLVRTKGFMDIF